MTLEQQVHCLNRLIGGEKVEKEDRAVTYQALDYLLKGKSVSLNAIPLHSCSLLNYSSHDIDRVLGLVAGAGSSYKNEALAASLYLQLADYSKARKIYDSLSSFKKLTELEEFLRYKCALAKKDVGFLKEFDASRVEALCELYPEVAYDVATRHVLLGREDKFVEEIKRLYPKDNVSEVLATAFNHFSELKIGDGSGDELDKSEDNAHLGKSIFAVYGMRCSGGSAVQDYFSGFKDVYSTAGEYLLFSGIYGIRALVSRKYDPYLFFEFLRHHLFSKTVPVNRTHSRVLRQSYFDREVGLADMYPDVVYSAIKNSNSRQECLHRLVRLTWRGYLSYSDKKLMLKKLFSSGNFDLLGSIPAITGFMVWRDPRDQYVDQMERGFVRTGDVETFVGDFLAKVERLKRGLLSATPPHRELFKNVGFEEFVNNASYRSKLSNNLGVYNIGSTNFFPEDSMRNIGIWKNSISLKEVKYIEKELGGFMDSAKINILGNTYV